MLHPTESLNSHPAAPLSIVVPCYFSSAFVRDILLAVERSQQPWPVVFVDDGSDAEEQLRLVKTISGHLGATEISHLVGDSSQCVSYFWPTSQSSVSPGVSLGLYKSNVGAFEHKKRAIEHAATDWVWLLDSDNVPDVDNLPLLSGSKLETGRAMLFHPTWHTIFRDHQLGPNHQGEQRKLELLPVSKVYGEQNLDSWTFSKLLQSRNKALVDKTRYFLNTGNFVVHASNYLVAHERAKKMWPGDAGASDVALFMLGWLASGFEVQLVQGWSYYHRLRENSHWRLAGRSDVADSLVSLIAAVPSRRFWISSREFWASSIVAVVETCVILKEIERKTQVVLRRIVDWLYLRFVRIVNRNFRPK